MLILLTISPLVESVSAVSTIADSFGDETKISTYNQLYVDTTSGLVRLVDHDQPLNSTGLVLWMHMNDVSGYDSETNVHDYSAEGNHGAKFDVGEPAWIPGGWYSGALNFDGADDYINCSSDNSLDNVWSDGGTFTAWINLNGPGTGGFGAGILAVKSVWLFEMYSYSEALDTAYLRFDRQFDSSVGYGWTDTRVLTKDVITFVAVTYNSSSVDNLPIVYVDGESVPFSWHGIPIGDRISDDSYDLLLGGDPEDFPFDGWIDEVRIYNRVLNTTEIEYAYNIGKAHYSDGLLYSINLLNGLSVKEITSFSYDASITGSEEIELQFSQDNSTWYSSTTINVWESLSDGANTLSLGTLDWSEGPFYYRANFTRGSTPELNSITLAYSAAIYGKVEESATILSSFLTLFVVILAIAVTTTGEVDLKSLLAYVLIIAILLISANVIGALE